MPVAWAIEGDGGFAMFMAVSAVAAAGGAACSVHVGGRPFHEKPLKFYLFSLLLYVTAANCRAAVPHGSLALVGLCACAVGGGRRSLAGARLSGGGGRRRAAAGGGGRRRAAAGGGAGPPNP
jgi:hypothetical protein